MASRPLPLNVPLTVLAPQDGLGGEITHFTNGGCDSFHLQVQYRDQSYDVIATPNRNSLRSERQKASLLIFDEAEIVVLGVRRNYSFRGSGHLSSNPTIPGVPAGKLTLATTLDS